MFVLVSIAILSCLDTVMTYTHIYSFRLLEGLRVLAKVAWVSAWGHVLEVYTIYSADHNAGKSGYIYIYISEMRSEPAG